MLKQKKILKGDNTFYWYKKELDPSQLERSDKWFCRICQFSCRLKGEIEEHVVLNHKKLKNPKQYQCHLCNENFLGKVALKRHLRITHSIQQDNKKQNKEAACTKCNYVGAHPSNLRIHYRDVHMCVKSYVCEYCPFAAAYKASVQDHMNTIHKKLRPFECSYCHEKFTRKYVLGQHVKALHLGEKPHQCSECDFRTVNR